MVRATEHTLVVRATARGGWAGDEDALARRIANALGDEERASRVLVRLRRCPLLPLPPLPPQLQPQKKAKKNTWTALVEACFTVVPPFQDRDTSFDACVGAITGHLVRCGAKDVTLRILEWK